MNAGKRSRELFDSKYKCAESVLMAVAESRGIKSDLIPGIATGFCSGLSRTCGLCGAVSGAVMALNLVYGRKLPDESVDKNYSAVNKFIYEFEKRYGTTNCYELIHCDLSTEKGHEYFRVNNLREQCGKYVEDAADIVMSIIDGIL